MIFAKGQLFHGFFFCNDFRIFGFPVRLLTIQLKYTLFSFDFLINFFNKNVKSRIPISQKNNCIFQIYRYNYILSVIIF